MGLLSLLLASASLAAPTITTVQPADGSNPVITTEVTATFSEAMDPATITPETFTVLRLPRGPAIAAGTSHTAALKGDGTVVAWGWNRFGQSTPPDGLTGVVAVAVGDNHTVALKSDGTVVAWGYNFSGTTEVPDGLSGVVAIAAGSIHTVALKDDGTVVAWGNNSYGQCTVPNGLSGVVAIAAGVSHTVALKGDGTVVAWGASWYGESTVPEGLSGVIAIAAGGNHTMALKGDSSVVAWGDTRFVPQQWQLSDVVAIAAGGQHFVALKGDGTVVATGLNYWGQCTVPAGLSGVVAIAAGGTNTVALKSDGKVVAWGNNDLGQSTVPTNLCAASIEGSVSYDQTTSTATFAPSAQLEGGVTYFATINIGARSAAGVPLAADIRWNFGLAIKTTSLPNGTFENAYSQTLIASGGKPPYTWSTILGALPPGLSLDATSGVISGTATALGTTPLTVQVQDANGATTTRQLSITIPKLVATITLAGLNQIYDGTPKSVTATTTPAGLAVSFTYNGNTTVPTTVGNYAIVATISDPNYQGIASDTLNIAKATATITLGNLNQIYDGTPKSVTATTTPAGLAVSFTYNGNFTVPTSAGDYAIVATISDPNYQGIASDTLNIAKATATIALGNLNQIYDGTSKTVTATTNPAGLTATFTYDGSATVPTNTGSYSVVATINDPNYQGGASGALTIAKATATITLVNLNQIYDGSPKSATATTNPAGLVVTFTYNGSATLPIAAGDYAVVATINDPNYQGSANGNLNIAKAAATITLGNLSQTYDSKPKLVKVTTAPAGLTVVTTYDGSAVPPKAVGSYAIVSTVNDLNYQGSASGILIISKIPATITLGNLSQTYDGTPKAATATTTPAGLTVNLTYNGSATAPTTAGDYTVVATISDPNYQGTANGTLNIARVAATITLGNLTQTYDGTPKAAAATTNPAGLAVAITYDGSATVPTAVGIFTVAATISDPNYQGTAGSILVIANANPQPASITLGNLSQTYDGTPKSATATTIPAGLAVTFTYNGSATVPANAGSYTVAATIRDPNYQGNAGGTLNVAKANQAINFTLPAKAKFRNSVPLTATASLPVSYVVSRGPGVIVGTDLTFTGIGFVDVIASQSGDSNYNAAANVTVTIEAVAHL